MTEIKKPDAFVQATIEKAEAPTHPQSVGKIVIESREAPIFSPNGQTRHEEHEEPQFKRAEAMTSAEITPELVKEASGFYRWIFGNTMHFAACPPCEMRGEDARLTARQAFDTGKEMVDLDRMDSEGLPPCPCCQGEMEYVYDPEAHRRNFEQKLLESDESYMSILRKADGSLGGLAFSYVTDVQREFLLEWGSKYPYMKPELQKPEHQRDLGKYLNCVKDIFREDETNPDKTVMAWNCISVSKDCAGRLPALLGNLFKAISPEHRKLDLLGDVRRNSPAHGIFLGAGGIEGTTFFDEKEGDILIGGPVEWAIASYTLPPEEFKKLKAQRLAERDKK
ncbi:hypothetical protein KKA95_03800 [Patescibacteria group bacterium]|nr:hypothetical protein [Patescibacteria group bacterium]